MDRTKIKMRITMWGVLGLALFHLGFGSDRFHPFLHWSMFSGMQHEPQPTTFEQTVLIAVDENQVEHQIDLTRYFMGWSRADQPGRLIQRAYFRRMRQGDVEAANEVARLIEAQTSLGDVIELRIERQIWTISESFREGTLRLNGQPLPPDEIQVEVLFPLDVETDANSLH